MKKVSIHSKDYPQNLRSIHRPPNELYIEGGFVISDKNAIAIVGTRQATYYGLRQCEKLAYDLSLRGITIVSGMARGIDSAAHRGALKALGRTIAVLGSGLNHVYPAENKKLYEEIVKSGAAISEYPPDTPPFKQNFPARNRIISGLSKGIVVIEAPRKSGALITVDFALEQGREVFALPGNISSSKSSGTNALIKDGAKLVENADDVLEELQYVMDIGPRSTLRLCSGQAVHGPQPITYLISDDERLIFEILGDKPKTIDEISEKTNLPTQKASEILLKLELKKLIKTLPGESFIKI